MSAMIKDRAAAAKAGIISGGAMTLLGLAMIYPLLLHFTQARQSEIPLLAIASNFGNVSQYMYMLVLIGAIFSTALSNGFAVVSWATERFKSSPLTVKLLLAVGGFFAANVGFSTMVAEIYPLFSVIGLAETMLILIAWIKLRKKA
jgi:uncharacterized membrane protein YkvI